MAQLQKFRWRPVYSLCRKSNTGCKVNLPLDYGKISGVYLIMDAQTKEIVYVGQSATQLLKTILRHFQRWTDTRYEKANKGKSRPTYTKFGYQVRFVLVSPTRAAKLEKALIQKYMPTDNMDKYEKYKDIEDIKNILKEYDDNPVSSDDEVPF